MGFTNALKYGAIGLGADLFTGGMTGGLGAGLGFLIGLFTPDARDMDRVYDPARAQPEHNTPEAKNEGWPTWAKVGAVAAGAALVLPALSSLAWCSAPLYPFSIWNTAFSPAGLIPLAWNAGLIPNWGWCAGFLF